LKELFANIALNIPVHKLFTYQVPENYHSDISAGKRVLVNFGRKIMTGVVLEIMDSTNVKGVKYLKSIIDPEPLFSEELIEFAKWVSGYYLAPIGEVVFSSLPKRINIESEIYYSLTDDSDSNFNNIKSRNEFLSDIIKLFKNKSSVRLTKQQIEKKLTIKDSAPHLKTLVENGVLKKENTFSRILTGKYIRAVKKNFQEETDAVIALHKIKSSNQIAFLLELSSGKEYELTELIRKTGISYASINTLDKKGLIKIFEVKKERVYDEIFTEEKKDIILNEDQEYILNEINSAVQEGVFKPFLLHGVTGSGKTEVYIRAIKKVITSGKSAIVLVPEISLTPQLIHRFKSHFGNIVGVIHSRLSEGERFDTLNRIFKKEYTIIIGARSALFAPVSNIGMIVVDEEHDSSYKQENSPRYNARDAALIRALKNNSVIILGSATPSLESYYNAQTGKYKMLCLEKRATSIKMPDIKIIDLKARQKILRGDDGFYDFFELIDKVKVKFLSKELIVEIGERLEKNESIIILQNRKGYHYYLECIDCGHVEMCKRCNVSMTYHKSLNIIKCHYCGYFSKLITKCSECSSVRIVPKGAGTEKVEEELVKIFPKAAIRRMDSETIHSGKSYQKILQDFYEKKINILVGTQIVSKGLDFPDVTLAGVINADIGLLHPDFRATERTFQILTQISGRSGRSDKKGEVIIQTNHPDYFVFEYVRNHDYIQFYDKEIIARRTMNYPPFSRVALVEIKSLDQKLAEGKIKELYNLTFKLDSNKILDILPPNPPLFSKLKDHHRYHMLIKSPKEKDPSGKYVISVLNALKEYSEKHFPSLIRVTLDMDAVNLL